MDQQVVMWLLGGLVVVIGWFASRKISDLEKADEGHRVEIAALKESKAEMKLHIAENYIKRSELKDFMERIDNNLKEIYAELKSKAEKHG